MTVLAWIIAATALDGILSVVAAGVLILDGEPFELPVLISAVLEQWGPIRRRAAAMELEKAGAARFQNPLHGGSLTSSRNAAALCR